MSVCEIQWCEDNCGCNRGDKHKNGSMAESGEYVERTDHGQITAEMGISVKVQQTSLRIQKERRIRTV